MLRNRQCLPVALLCGATVCSVSVGGQSSAPPVAPSRSGILEGKRLGSKGTGATFLELQNLVPGEHQFTDKSHQAVEESHVDTDGGIFLEILGNIR